MVYRQKSATRNSQPVDDLQPIPIPDPPEEPGHELRMGFFEHLNELRLRVTRAFAGVLIGTVIGFVFASPVIRYLVEPYAERLVVLGPTGAVVAYFRVSLMMGAILAFPIILYQILMFVLPGLTSKERRVLFTALPAVMGLFLIGVAFAWFVLTPPAIGFLEGFQQDLFRNEWTADQYLGFITALLFWMGAAFELPLVFFVLSTLGLVQASGLIKNWRVAVVGAALAAALITPTVDPMNMALVMGPLLGLYAISIVLVMIGWRISGRSS